jgi:hypothetical protein
MPVGGEKFKWRTGEGQLQISKELWGTSPELFFSEIPTLELVEGEGSI